MRRKFLESKVPLCHPLFLKVISRVSYPHLATCKARRARTEPPQSKFRFTLTTSWPPSPIQRGFLCHSCNRSPASQGHLITPSNHLNHRARKGRDREVRPTNSLLQRNRNPMTNRQMGHLTLRKTGVILPHLRQSLPLNPPSQLQLNDSQTRNPSHV